MFYSFSVEGRCVLDGSTVGTIPATSSNASSEEEERFSSVSGRGWMEMEMVAWVVVDGVCVAWMVTVIVHTYS